MKKEEKILEYIKNHEDMITIEELNGLNIQTIYLTRLLEKNIIYRLKKGLYCLSNTWGDEYFNLIYSDNFTIYSHLTALYFHGLSERVPQVYDITVKQNYCGPLLKNEKVKLHYVDKDIFEIGKIKIKSPQGREITCYDVERCLCDLLKDKNDIYFEYLKYAFVEYYRNQKHDTLKLYQYAKKMKIEDKVTKFMEVLL